MPASLECLARLSSQLLLGAHLGNLRHPILSAQINIATRPAAAPTRTPSTFTPVALPACAVAVCATLFTLEAILDATDAKDSAAEAAADSTDLATDATEDA